MVWNMAAPIAEIVGALRKTFAVKMREFADVRGSETTLVRESVEVLSKRLGSLIEKEGWDQKQLLEMSAIAFLLALSMEHFERAETV